MARMQHRDGAVERSEARQARIVAPRVFVCVGSCIAVAVSIVAFVSRAMSFRRRSVPSVSSFNTHSSLDQDRRRTNPIAPTTITEMSERESTKLIEVEIERKEEKAMVCGDALHMITCVAGKKHSVDFDMRIFWKEVSQTTCWLISFFPLMKLW